MDFLKNHIMDNSLGNIVTPRCVKQTKIAAGCIIKVIQS